MFLIKIYRTTDKHGSVIETEEIDQLTTYKYPQNLNRIVEKRGGDFATVKDEETLNV